MKLFVYGTLKKGHGNHSLLDGSHFLGELKMWMPFEMYDLGLFPALCCSRGNLCWIEGEVYQVSDTVMDCVDVLEGYPDLYEKTTLNTKFGDTTLYYFNNKENCSVIIPDGKWV